jgi:lysozyme
MIDFVRGFDVSYFQDLDNTPQQIDFKKAYAAGLRFALIRASQNGWKDPDFDYNWQAAADAGFLRGAYHLLEYRPTEAPLSATRQAQFFCSVLERHEPGELPETLDMEKPNAAWPELPDRTTCLGWFDSFMAVTLRERGRDSMLYTNRATILYRLAPVPERVRKHPLWYAAPIQPTNGMTPEQYIETYTTRPVVVPTYWPEWKFWQYSWHGDGRAFGCESGNVDLNFYNGTLDELRAWAGVDTPEPPPALTLEQRVARIEQHLGLT